MKLPSWSRIKEIELNNRFSGWHLLCWLVSCSIGVVLTVMLLISVGNSGETVADVREYDRNYGQREEIQKQLNIKKCTDTLENDLAEDLAMRKQHRDITVTEHRYFRSHCWQKR